REWGIQLPENPVRMVRRPAAPKARDRRFREGDEARLRLACEDARNPFLVPVIELAIESGMRQGEIVGLLWQGNDRACAMQQGARGSSHRDESTRLGYVVAGLPHELLRGIGGAGYQF